MNKVLVRCWHQDIPCSCEKKNITRIYFNLSDFYEGFELFICPKCKEKFALDKETFKYLRKGLNDLLQHKHCPGCNDSLLSLLKYPLNYYCSSCNDHFIFDEAVRNVKNKSEEIKEFYDLLSE